MPEASTLLAFTPIVALLILTPGPDMLFILAIGARAGSRVGLSAAGGIAAATAIHAVGAAVGLVAVFRLVPITYDVVRFAGAAYLFYIGITTWRERGAWLEAPAEAQRSAWTARRAFLWGMVTDLLNPKVILFNAAFLPQFVDPEGGHVVAQMLLLGLVFVMVGLAIEGPMGLLAGRMGSTLTRRASLKRRLDLATAAVLVGLSAHLALRSH